MSDVKYPTCPIANISDTEYNAHVYAPSDDTFALVDAFTQDFATWEKRETLVCVEVGSGSGYVITSAVLAMQSKQKRCTYIAIDVAEEALAATARTLRAHGVDADVVRCDLLSAMQPRMLHKVDLILFNPPYVVTPDEEVAIDGIAAAWAGGKDGRVVIDRFLRVVDDFLSPSGLAYMILVHDNKPQQVMDELHIRTNLKGNIILSRRADEELLYVLRISR
jgi:release factor glutamine methyltransferase